MRTSLPPQRLADSGTTARSLLIVVCLGTILCTSEARSEDASRKAGWSVDRLREPPAGVQWISFYTLQDLQPVQPEVQQPLSAPQPQTPAQRATTNRIFAGGAPRSNLKLVSRPVARRTAADSVLGIESKARSASDGGSLLGRSTRGKGVTAQRRSPIITDPRIRGSRVGQLAASGSHWVPARVDLDTILSKVDSRIISDIAVIKGPYASRYGPGFAFLDFELQASPRSNGGTEIGGSTSLDYQTNGERWYGRQTVTVAEEDWGVQFGYGHRTGSDYDSGDGIGIPSSYKSRDMNLIFGWDIADGQSVEAYWLHQDQTDVELPGQAFDIDSSVTNAFGATWVDETTCWADRVELETWYNETQLTGSSQRAGKRRIFPFLNEINFIGNTDVESISTGARMEAGWELDPDRNLVAGIDLRVVRQDVDENSSRQFVFIDPLPPPDDIDNSPLPRSASVNPGLFVEMTDTSMDGLTLTTGARIDIVTTEVLSGAGQTSQLGISPPQTSLANILGTDDFHQEFGLWSAFLNGEFEADDNWRVQFAAGHGQRAPNLTELYTAESFMFLLQSGLNTVTGDPRLNPERRWQIDLGTTYDDDQFHFGINGYHAWVQDRITFENFGFETNGLNTIEQTNLKYVNTDRARIYGFEADAEYEFNNWLSVFGTVSFVEGVDETRNGNFVTLQRQGDNESIRDPSFNRGSSQNGNISVTGNSNRGVDVPQESLPGVPPLESRVGVRADGTLEDVRWNVELAARIVNSQSRIASTLGESRTPGFTVWDLRSYWEVSENLTFVAGVENFTDTDYREHLDYRSLTGLSIRQPGVNCYFGSELTY
jgi:outer membrane receptor protein involved in Fe transport